MKENRALKNTEVYKMLKKDGLYEKWGERLTETVDSLRDESGDTHPDGVAAITYSTILANSKNDLWEYGLGTITDYLTESIKNGKGKEQAAHEASMLGKLITYGSMKSIEREKVEKYVDEMKCDFMENDKIYGTNQGRNVIENLQKLRKGRKNQ